MANWAASQSSPRLSFDGSYSDATLGFRYIPPQTMKDITEAERAEIASHGVPQHTDNALNLVLSMSSGPDPTVHGWQSLYIETYPRLKFSDLDDTEARAKMTAWVVGAEKLLGKSSLVDLAGQRFTVAVFGEQDGNLRKGAVVWTTIRRGKLLSFAFVSNSPLQLQKLTESMKNLRFF